MAQLRRVIRSNPISSFDQKGPQGGAAFAVLADAAQTLYERMAPAAMEKMKATGAEEGRRLAQQQAGGQRVRVSTMGGANGVSEAARAAFGSLEQRWGRPLKVTSAFRDPEHNARVGGAKNSQHMQGNAFDLDVSDLSQEERVSLIREARAAGFRGVGVYDNSLHFDVGPDRAWGASYGRDSLPAWAAEAVASPVGNLTVSTKGSDTTMVRTAEGKLEPRLYSPYAGEILQAHNIAAGIAYQSEMLNSGLVDLLSISQEFPLNPEGFEQAAREYVDSVVENAPEAFKADLRGSLEKEAQRRFLGMVDEKHRDIRQRADNSSRALMDRWSTNYAEALASGNDDEAQAALAELQSVLRAREALPGAAWTPEQSANVVMDSQRAAARLGEQRLTEARKEASGFFDLYIEAKKNGRNVADESRLNDPAYAALDPEGHAEAVAYGALYDSIPDLHQMTPAQQQAELTAYLASPVAQEFEVDLGRAAQGIVTENARLWNDDPVQRGYDVLVDKPPQMPDPSVDGLDKLGEWMGAMVAWSDRKRQEGYFTDPVFFTNQQNEALSAVLGQSSDPQTRAAVALAIAQGAGDQAARDQAARVFSSLKVDPVLKSGAMLVAGGGDPQVLSDALLGQELLATGQKTLPRNAMSMADHNIEAASVFMDMGIDGTGAEMRGVMELAAALYAADPASKAADPSSDAASQAYASAINRALGQTERSGKLYGGVQPVLGLNTLLPPTVNGKAASDALRAAARGSTKAPDPRVPGSTRFEHTVNQQAWAAASRSNTVPFYAGQPISPDKLTGGEVSLVPITATEYRLIYNDGNSSRGVPLTDDRGMTYVFDIEKLIDATRAPQVVVPQMPAATGGTTDPMMIAP